MCKEGIERIGKIMISLDENNKKLESLKDRLIDVGDSL